MSINDDLKDFRDKQIEVNAGSREALAIVRNTQHEHGERIDVLEDNVSGYKHGLNGRVLILEQRLSTLEKAWAQKDKDKAQRSNARLAIVLAVIACLTTIVATIIKIIS